MLVYVILTTTLGLGCGASGKPRDVSRGNDSFRAVLTRAGQEIRHAVESGRTEPIVKYVGPDGMGCGDSNVSREKFKADIAKPGTWLHSYLFDEATFKKKYAGEFYAMSLSAFFRVGQNITSTVVVDDVGPDGRAKSACVRFAASNLEYMPLICFCQKGKQWFLSESLYACG